MAMNIQKANKDKWYDQYSSIFSTERPLLHKDTIRSTNKSPKHYRL